MNGKPVKGNPVSNPNLVKTLKSSVEAKILKSQEKSINLPTSSTSSTSASKPSPPVIRSSPPVEPIVPAMAEEIMRRTVIVKWAKNNGLYMIEFFIEPLAKLGIHNHNIEAMGPLNNNSE